MPYTDPRGSLFASMPPAITEDSNSLGYANEWMQRQPWYAALLQSWGQSPGNVHLSDQQRNQLLVVAQQNGLAIAGDYDRNGQPTGPEGRFEFDESGNIRTQTHRLRKGLTAAAIVGGAIAGGYGLNAAFGGAGAGGAGAVGGASAGGGALPSTTIGTGYIGGISGGTGLGGAAGGFSTGLGASGAASTAGLLSGYGSTAGAGGAAVLPSTTIGTGAIGGISGGTGLSGGSGAGAGIWRLLSRGGNSGRAGDLADILAGIEGGRAEGRIAAGNANATQANAAANIFRTRMSSALTGPRSSAQDAAFGDTMANVQPFSWTGGTHRVGNIPVPDATGGLSPANFGPNTRAAGRDLSALGASRVNSPAFALPDPPTLPDLPQSNLLDTGLGVGSTLAALWDLYRGRRT